MFCIPLTTVWNSCIKEFSKNVGSSNRKYQQNFQAIFTAGIISFCSVIEMNYQVELFHTLEVSPNFLDNNDIPFSLTRTITVVKVFSSSF